MISSNDTERSIEPCVCIITPARNAVRDVDRTQRRIVVGCYAGDSSFDELCIYSTAVATLPHLPLQSVPERYPQHRTCRTPPYRPRRCGPSCSDTAVSYARTRVLSPTQVLRTDGPLPTPIRVICRLFLYLRLAPETGHSHIPRQCIPPNVHMPRCMRAQRAHDFREDALALLHSSVTVVAMGIIDLRNAAISSPPRPPRSNQCLHVDQPHPRFVATARFADTNRQPSPFFLCYERLWCPLSRF